MRETVEVPDDCPAWLSDDGRQLVERAARCIASVRLSLIDAASAHVRMAPDEHLLDGRQRAAAVWWVERLATVLCQIEELGLEALDDDLLPDEEIAMLEALEESFLFALSANDEHRSQVLTVEEVDSRVLALDANGTWHRNPSVVEG